MATTNEDRFMCAYCNRTHYYNRHHDCFTDADHTSDRDLQIGGHTIGVSLLRCSCGGIAAVQIRDDKLGDELYTAPPEYPGDRHAAKAV